jgi:hypothetical protein
MTGEARSADVTTAEARMARLRGRLAETSEDDGALRVMLVLAHELVHQQQSAARTLAPPESSATLPSVAGAVSPGANGYPELVNRVRDIVTRVVPPGASILVLSKGDDALLAPGVAAAHFPQDSNRAYAGYYPADSAAAVGHLEHCCADGSEFIVFPNTAYWWLEKYPGLTQHLLVRARVVYHDADCLIFDVRAQATGAGDT